jgi:protein gp37
VKVSDGCTNCYAETQSKRNPGVLGIWGPAPKGKRIVGTDDYWKQPLAWDKQAKEAGERRRVFSASLADVFEEFSGDLVDTKGQRLFSYVDINASAIDGSVGANLDHARARLFRLILDTPNLDWMLLTKRPQNILPMLKTMLRMFEADGADREVDALRWWIDPPDQPVVGRLSRPPHNIWLGTSVENQETANQRIPLLREVPAVCRFLSIEPLLSRTRLNLALYAAHPKHDERWPTERVNGWWVIVGGESGPDSRPMHPDWVREIRDECLESNVPFLFKQWGEWGYSGWQKRTGEPISRAVFPDGSHLPDLTGRGTNGDGAVVMYKVGKKAAGRMLDGRTWDEVPEPLKNRRVQTVP